MSLKTNVFKQKNLKTNSYRFFSLAFWHHFKIFVQYRSCHKTYPMYVKTVQIESTLSNIDFLKIWQQITKESLLKTCLVFNEIYRGKKDILLACSLLIWSIKSSRLYLHVYHFPFFPPPMHSYSNITKLYVLV